MFLETGENMNKNEIKFRHIRVTDTVGDYYSNRRTNQDHVLTLATRLDGDKMYIGYSLNRVSKYCSEDGYDRFDPELGKIRAAGRLNSSSPIEIKIDRTKPMIDNIIRGLLELPTAVEPNQKQAVPSALKNLLRKSLKEYKTKKNVTV